MTHIPDIESLFKQNKSTFNETPRREVWAKLDQRLEIRERQLNRFKWVKYMAAASIFIALLSSVVVFKHIEDRKNNNGLSMMENTQSTNIERVREKDKNPPDATFEEKPVSAKTEAHPVPAVKTPIYSPMSPQMESVTATNNIASDDAPIHDDYALKAESAKGYGDYAVDVNVPENDYTNRALTESKLNVNPAAVYHQNSIASAKAEYRDKALQIVVDEKIKPFIWMQGVWKDDNLENNSVETWTLKNSGTLEGVGMTVNGRDTLFKERMTIQKDGEDVYFIANADQQNRRVKFRLYAQNGNRFTFEQNGVEDLPWRVVIERKNHNTFSVETTYRSNSKFSKDQVIYLNNRNFVNSQKAVRNLRKG